MKEALATPTWALFAANLPTVCDPGYPTRFDPDVGHKFSVRAIHHRPVVLSSAQEIDETLFHESLHLVLRQPAHHTQHKKPRGAAPITLAALLPHGLAACGTKALALVAPSAQFCRRIGRMTEPDDLG